LFQFFNLYIPKLTKSCQIKGLTIIFGSRKVIKITNKREIEREEKENNIRETDKLMIETKLAYQRFEKLDKHSKNKMINKFKRDTKCKDIKNGINLIWFKTYLVDTI
jgi:hypothetical protein